MLNCLLIDPLFQVAPQLNGLLSQTLSFRLSQTLNDSQSIGQLSQYGPYMPVFCVATPAVRTAMQQLPVLDTKLLVLLSDDPIDAALAYDCDAVDFLRIPLNEVRLWRCLDKLTRFSQYAANGYRETLPKMPKLTRMQRIVLYKIGEQKTTRQIADELFVSVKTIDTHRANIRTTLQFDERRPLTPFAVMVVQQGLIEKNTD